MTVTLVYIGSIVVLAMALTLIVTVLLIKQRQNQTRPSRQQPAPDPAAPHVNPLLHDETLLGAEADGPAGDRRAGAASHVSVVAGAPQQTYALYAGRPVMIGRHSSHPITLANHRVSRNHARLVLIHDGKVQISDLGSRNGTFVGQDKRRLAPHAHELLAPGDVFWIGTDVKLAVGAAPANATPSQAV